MSAVPEGVDLTDPRARAAWGPIDTTPERLAAWTEWKANYVAGCIEQYVQQGATREDASAAGYAIWSEYSSIGDDEPWMPLGVAKAIEVQAMLDPEQSVLTGQARRDFMIATRTSVTSTDSERALNAAYQLGLTVQQASSLLRGQLSQVFGADEPHAGRTALYRHFDADGMLLYIGIAKDPAKRSEQHGYHSRWWRFVNDTTIEWFASRSLAAAEERRSIAAERPVFNQTHNRTNTKAATDYLFEALNKSAAS